jgi:hypothetical protein
LLGCGGRDRKDAAERAGSLPGGLIAAIRGKLRDCPHLHGVSVGQSFDQSGNGVFTALALCPHFDCQRRTVECG